MIESNELRQGNLLYLKDRIVTVEGIPNTIRLLVQWEQFAVDIEEFEPIPISDTILVQCGFEKKDDTFVVLDIKNAVLNKIYSRNNVYYLYLSDYGIDFQITYLHQLQNLYFVLQQEELQIRL